MNRLRVVLVISGVLVMAYAVGGALTDPGVKPFGVLSFLVAVLVAHDLLWMPVVLLAGALLTRFATPLWRTLAITVAALLVVAVPLTVAARPADNPSVLPLDYGRNLLLLLAVIAVTGIVAAITSRIRKRMERPADPDGR